jgi:transcriptional regulator with XRE-family HTH domain
MPDAHHRSMSFAERLDFLFNTVTGPDGRLYSLRAAADALRAAGHDISHGQLGRLRHGTAEPRHSDMEALAGLFGTTASFFTDRPDASAATVPDDPIVRALRDPAIRKVALRMADSGLSAAGRAAVADMLETVIRMEQQARAQHGDQPGGTT